MAQRTMDDSVRGDPREDWRVDRGVPPSRNDRSTGAPAGMVRSLTSRFVPELRPHYETRIPEANQKVAERRRRGEAQKFFSFMVKAPRVDTKVIGSSTRSLR